MKMKSNIMPATGIYPINNQGENTEFLSAIHGRVNIETYLKKKYFSVDRRLYTTVLTQEQIVEFERTAPCALLKNNEELVWGMINTEKGLCLRCRCYKKDCPLYSVECMQHNPESVHLTVLTPQIQVVLDNTDSPSVSITDPSGGIPATASAGFVFKPEQTGQTYEITENKGNVSESEDCQTIFRIIHSDITDKQYVTAPPGAGKTHNLIEKLKYLSEVNNAANSILVLCYTRAAVSEIRSRLEEAVRNEELHDDIKRIYIVTFDSFATRVLLDRSISVNGMNYDVRIETASSEIAKDPSILKDVLHFIVDETQDLVGVRADLVKNILDSVSIDTGITLFGDPLQGIYDYEVRNAHTMITSVELNRYIRNKFSSLQILQLKENRRQIESLKYFSRQCRQLLESENADNIKHFFDLLSRIQSAGGVKALHRNSFPKDEVTAILCRNNGEVLDISDQMNAYGVRHIVRRTEDMTYYPDWIVDLFMEETELIGQERIHAILTNRLPDSATTDQIFRALTQDGRGNGEYIFSKKLKRALQKNENLDIQYAEKGNNIILSTIHQAKGREFDNVILVQSDPAWREYEDLFDEAKVYYVGITRARKRLLRADISNRNSYFAGKYSSSRRFVEITSRNGNKNILRVEVGKAGDLDLQSFVDTAILENPEETQKYMVEAFKTYKTVDLLLDQSINPSTYRIILNGRTIGAMSKVFTSDIADTFYNATGKRAPRYIEDVMADRLFAIAVPQETYRSSLSINAIKRGVWYGLKLTGLGIAR